MALIESIAFNYQSNRFVARHSYAAQVMESLGDALYSFNSGLVVKHGAHTTAYKKSSVTFVNRQEPSQVKVWCALAVEGNTPPTAVECSNTLPHAQFTDLVSADFTQKEGVYYSTLYRDKNSPNVATGKSALLTGDPMRSQTLKVYVKFDTLGQKVNVKHVNTMYKDSYGHNV